jgi:1,4-dihydroxy-2-naphthoate octaprenyltransferase
METKGLPNVFILMIVGGVFVLIFLGKSDLGIKLGMALVGAGTTGIVAASTYQRHAETLANWSIVIVISILCFGILIAAAIFYTKYIRANKAFKEVVESAVPAFEALKEKIGSEKTKAVVWVTQSDATIAKVEEVKKELLTENTKPQI